MSFHRLSVKRQKCENLSDFCLQDLAFTFFKRRDYLYLHLQM